MSGRYVPWGLERQLRGSYLVGSAAAWAGGAGRVSLWARDAADLAFYAMLSVEQLVQAEVLRRYPSRAVEFARLTTPTIGGTSAASAARNGLVGEGALPQDIATLYDGTQGLCRRLYRTSVRSVGAHVEIPAGVGAVDGQLGLPHAVVAGVVCVVVAALFSGAWVWGKDREAARGVEAATAAATAKATLLSEVAKGQIAAGQPVDLKALAGADFAAMLRDYAGREATGAWSPWLAGGAVLAGVAVLSR